MRGVICGLGMRVHAISGGNNSNRYCAGGSGGGVMGDRSCEVWFEVRFGHVVPHMGCQDWACGGGNVAGMG